MDYMKKVSGENKDRDVEIFTLSTCAWCKKVKKLLKNLDIEYKYADIDLLSGKEKERAEKDLEEYNPQMSTPTIVVDGGDTVIVGFKEEKIEEELSN